MNPVAMNTAVYFIWNAVYCCHMDSNCIGITNGLVYICSYREGIQKKPYLQRYGNTTESKRLLL